MNIYEYQVNELLDDLKRIESDLNNSTIYAGTIRAAKILVANLEYYYEKED